jgi:hypothetical protein
MLDLWPETGRTHSSYDWPMLNTHYLRTAVVLKFTNLEAAPKPVRRYSTAGKPISGETELGLQRQSAHHGLSGYQKCWGLHHGKPTVHSGRRQPINILCNHTSAKHKIPALRRIQPQGSTPPNYASMTSFT